MKISKTAPALAMLMLAAQPCHAAEDYRDVGSRERRSSAFAGATIRLPIGGDSGIVRRPEARLQAGFSHSTIDRRTGFTARASQLGGLEIGAGAAGKPALYLGGRQVTKLESKQNISTAGAVALGVGVTLLALVVLVAASSPPEIDWDD